MKLNNTILRSYNWEGFEGELYQNFQRFMDHMEMDQQHNSMKDLIQPSLSLFEEGNRTMHHSICLRRTIGEEHTYVNHILFPNCMPYFTMYMQTMTPKRSVIPYKLHVQLFAKTISDYGHFLGEQREILQHDGCFPKAPNISSTFSHGEMLWAEIQWW